MKGYVKGFVIGWDPVGDDKVWKVRVKEEGHEEDGNKFVVASQHNNIVLAQGLDVHFQLASFKERGRIVLKAIDVRVGFPDIEKGTPGYTIPDQLEYPPCDYDSFYKVVMFHYLGDHRTSEKGCFVEFVGNEAYANHTKANVDGWQFEHYPTEFRPNLMKVAGLLRPEAFHAWAKAYGLRAIMCNSGPRIEVEDFKGPQRIL